MEDGNHKVLDIIKY